MALAGHCEMEKLVADYYAPLYRFAYRLTGDAMDAEDLTQEAFCAAQGKLHQLRDPSKVKGWLFSILRNAYLHRYRAEKQRRFLLLGDASLDVAEPAPEDLAPFDSEQLQEALNGLPEAFRTPIILFYFDGFSYRKISDQLDVPIGTVMSRLARAKAYLRWQLAGRQSEFAGSEPGG